MTEEQIDQLASYVSSVNLRIQFKSAIRQAVEKGSIGFANWINDNEHIYGDNWGGGNLSKPAEELYKEYQQSLNK